MIKAGSKVQVTDWMYGLTTPIGWFKKYGDSVSLDYVARFAYCDMSKFENERYNDTTIYLVLSVADDCALIVRDFSTKSAEVGDKTYLVEIKGLKECVDKDTIKSMLKSMSIGEIREIIDEILR